MKKTLPLFTFFLIVVSALFYFQKNENPIPPLPEPTNGKKYRTDQEEGEDGQNRRQAWIELIHKAAPGTDWREMDRQAARELARTRQYISPQNNTRGTETFADGNVEGEWRERGSANQAGNMRTVEYVPQLNKIYGIAAGGSLWRGNLDGSDWTVLNDDFLLNPAVLKAFYPTDTSGMRLIGASGKDLMYSDDEGQAWEVANFLPDFYDGWGSPNNVSILSDSLNTIYYLAHTWDAQPWAARSWLYRSTDGGQNFQRIKVFDQTDKWKVSLWASPKTEQVFVLERGLNLYTINADTIFSVPTNGLSDDGDAELIGYATDSTLILYALIDNHEVYKSNNGGADWILQGETPANAWNVGMVCSPFDSLRLFSGAVNCHFSIDGGITWELANEWWEYYNDLDKFHADIMDFGFYEKMDSTPFFLIANHGGLHISYDHLETTQNISLEGMNIGQYYDVLTNQDFPNFIYLGSQDQGWQWTAEGDEETPVDFTQQWSGDYGQMLMSNGNQSYWTQYPGGIMDYYHFAFNPPNPWPESEFNVEGEDMPAVGWIVPTANLEAFPDGNTVFVGGGNLDEGPGSYLIALTASTGAPYDISTTQFDFDFKENSNSGEGLISAIEQSPFFEGDRIYVAADDGTFFTTYDGGVNWEKSPGFSGPTTSWLYTACILASKIDPEVVYVSGSGYSNPAVFKSIDGGITFEPIDDGLPGTLVQELAANNDETLLFAATTLGPFVYVTWEDQWYPLLGESTPLQWYTSVEYIASTDIVRFSTYGRGVWDFEVTFVEGPPVAVFENDKNIKVDIFPNPILRNGILNIEMDHPNEAGFVLMDLQGKIVKRTALQDAGQIGMEELAAGTYFYRISSQGEKIGVGKIVVQ